MSSKLPASATDRELLHELGRRLEALRRRRGLTQAEAAAASGVSRRTLYSAESGENPTLRTVIRLLRTYGRLGALDDFIPVLDVSPIELIEAEAEAKRAVKGRRVGD